MGAGMVSMVASKRVGTIMCRSPMVLMAIMMNMLVMRVEWKRKRWPLNLLHCEKRKSKTRSRRTRMMTCYKARLRKEMSA